MPKDGDSYAKYLDLNLPENACRLYDYEYDAFKHQISDEGSSSSVATFVDDDRVSLGARISFETDNNHRLHMVIDQNRYWIECVSDLLGTDRVLRPSNSRKLSRKQVRVYMKWSQYLRTGNVYFTGAFSCVNRLTGASSQSQARVEADRPVPFHRHYIPNRSYGSKVCSIELARSIGRMVYHVSNRGNVRLDEVDDTILYLGSGRLRRVHVGSESSSDDEYMGARSDEDEDEDFCNCAELVIRYREVAAKYNLEAFADQVLRDRLQHQITKSGREEDEYTKEVHVCRKYHVPGAFEFSETFWYETIARTKTSAVQHDTQVRIISALRLEQLVDFDAKACRGEYDVVRVNVRRNFLISRREVRKVRDICRLGNCVCEIARKSQLPIQEVHRLLLKVPGSHTNHIFGACYANRRGVYTGDRTGSEKGCSCLENSLTLRDVIGVICNQFGEPIVVARHGVYPVIEFRTGYAHICSWSNEDTFMPEGIDLNTKIAGWCEP